MEDAERLSLMEARIDSLEEAVQRLMRLTARSSVVPPYPEPLATPLAHESGARMNMERFFSLVDAGEACVQYTGVIAIAVAIAAGHPPDLREFFRQAPALGKWAEITRNIVCAAWLPQGLLSRALKDSLLQANGKPTPAGRYLMDEFVRMRNIQKGHGASRPDGVYEQLYLRHADTLHDALAECQYLRYPLVSIEAAHVSTVPFSYDVRVLVGPAPLTRMDHIQCSDRLGRDKVAVWDNAGNLLDLGNLLLYSACQVCSLPHTFFLERVTDKALSYYSNFGNHRFEQPIGATGRV